MDRGRDAGSSRLTLPYSDRRARRGLYSQDAGWGICGAAESARERGGARFLGDLVRALPRGVSGDREDPLGVWRRRPLLRGQRRIACNGEEIRRGISLRDAVVGHFEDLTT